MLEKPLQGEYSGQKTTGSFHLERKRLEAQLFQDVYEVEDSKINVVASVEEWIEGPNLSPFVADDNITYPPPLHADLLPERTTSPSITAESRNNSLYSLGLLSSSGFMSDNLCNLSSESRELPRQSFALTLERPPSFAGSQESLRSVELKESSLSPNAIPFVFSSAILNRVEAVGSHKGFHQALPPAPTRMLGPIGPRSTPVTPISPVEAITPPSTQVSPGASPVSLQQVPKKEDNCVYVVSVFTDQTHGHALMVDANRLLLNAPVRIIYWECACPP